MEIALLIISSLGLCALAFLIFRSFRADAKGGPDALKIVGELVDREIRRLHEQMQQQSDRITSENQRHARELREELQNLFAQLSQSNADRMGEIAAQQKSQLEGFARQLNENLQASHTASESLRSSLMQQLGELREASVQASQAMQDRLSQQLETKLTQLREENSAKLEEMRQTVDEKLQGTLEKRLGESFKIVSDRLEQVHRGLGEMQNLASGVGDLKRVLTNVKNRGTWGEYQLHTLLEEMLVPEQYAANVRVRPDSRENVEFAIRLPGKDDQGDQVLLPIDAKFPKEDYERLLDAQEAADKTAAEQAGRQLEASIKKSAKDIATKYIVPPATTDFAIMFLPSEGLFAEVVRRPGLAETIRREHHVMLAGPTTFTSVLSALQMGFRTLAIEQRSGEVWRLLSVVKSEFDKFGGALDKVKKKLQEASNQVETVETRTRVMSKQLRGVEDALPENAGARIVELPLPDGNSDRS